MKIFWINLEVNFQNSRPIFSEEGIEQQGYTKGFLQEIGCTAESEEDSKRIIVDHLKDINWLDFSQISLKFDRFGEIDSNQVDAEIYGDPDINDSLLGDPRSKGIWYLSGKAFFTDDVDGNELHDVKIIEETERTTN